MTKVEKFEYVGPNPEDPDGDYVIARQGRRENNRFFTVDMNFPRPTRNIGGIMCMDVGTWKVSYTPNPIKIREGYQEANIPPPKRRKRGWNPRVTFVPPKKEHIEKEMVWGRMDDGRIGLIEKVA